MDRLIERAKIAAEYRTTDPMVGELAEALEHERKKFEIAQEAFATLSRRLENMQAEIITLRAALKEMEAAARAMMQTFTQHE